MNDFIFQNTTKIYFGQDHLKNLGNEVKQHGKRVLITFGGGSIKKIGLFDKVTTELKQAGLEVFEFGGIEPNPRVETVNACAAYCRAHQIDVLLAVGGGSTLDATKVIAAAVFYDGDAWDLVIKKAPMTQALPIVTILTLSATGSEMNNGGVISKMDTHEKIGVGHPLMQPKASFLDPTNTYSVNAFQTAAGTADMMSHMIEQYFTLESMDMMDEISEAIMRTIIKYGPKAIENPLDYEARENLMWASTWALNGFVRVGKTTGWSCHAMEHELSAFYDITHGLGLAILTPRWMSYVLDESNVHRFVRFGQKVFGLTDEDPMLCAKHTISQLEDFFQIELQLPGNLSYLNIDETHFKEMAQKACKYDVIKGLMTLTAGDVEAIYKMCL
jgi:alcohol dehydrogenase YqhD (iron-dependent ADH family)